MIFRGNKVLDGTLASIQSGYGSDTIREQPAFHCERLAGYASAMSECAVRWRESFEAGSTLDISTAMPHLTLSIVAKTLFSADIESEAPEIGAAMTSILELFRVLLLPFSIRERRKSGVDTGDLLSMLLLAQDEDDRMTDQQVRDEALTLFLAGHETTANALTWTWHFATSRC
jgi:cytochrome P450